ncbi:adenylyltransferase/cytidyltransferase family protein [Flavobacteriaceae bacterium]|nr:adenylyltransferase/cytidyltransferase family protein [Flavobacteriaceae bacterium]
MKKNAIIVSGYFNPLHKGHIEYFTMAKGLADELIVVVNNDKQRSLKGAKEFMLEDERCLIISSLKIVDKVFLSVDDDRTVIKTIEMIYNEISDSYNLIFGNGGDQNNLSIPESEICKKLDIKLIDNLGEKIQSSSWLLNKKQ